MQTEEKKTNFKHSNSVPAHKIIIKNVSQLTCYNYCSYRAHAHLIPTQLPIARKPFIVKRIKQPSKSFNITDKICPPSLPEIYIQICPTLTSVLLHPTLSVLPKHPEVNFSPHEKQRATSGEDISSDINNCYLHQLWAG